MDRSGLADAFPELIRAAEGPVLDTSCAALLRLAQAVHHQGYKVALTGEGADEALAGYVWYKVQAIRDGITAPDRSRRPEAAPHGSSWAPWPAGRPLLPPELAIGGARPAQQDLYELISQAKPTVYSDEHVAAAGRSQPVRRPGYHQRPHRRDGIRSTSRSTSATR